MAFSDREHQDQALYQLPSRSFPGGRANDLNNHEGRPAKPPPRSRSGCWTCRTRKVKCDESRPRCLQCVRLNHECDYSSKFAFKDETPKVVDKYLESAAASPSWSQSDPTELQGRRSITIPDSLPPFTQLTKDEDWQQKAVYQPAGTYFVVANSESFAGNAEYKSSSSTASVLRSPGLPEERPNTNIPLDPKTVILGTFEDASRRITADGPSTLKYPGPESIWPVEELMFHWRSVARAQLFELDGVTTSASMEAEDLVESTALAYLPLRNALLALASLSLSIKQGMKPVKALEYYNQAVNGLMISHTEQELVSDGLLLTHYILLVYEIAATERFWYNHMEPLNAIISQRKFILSKEPLANIIFSICMIDATALMSCSGAGMLVVAHILNNSIPMFEDFKDATPILPKFASENSAVGTLEPLFDLLRDLMMLWTRIGHTSRQIRQEIQNTEEQAHAQGSRQPMIAPAASLLQWIQQAKLLREAVKNRWNMALPPALAAQDQQRAFGGQMKQIYEHATILYHSSMIYGHTSIWPTQGDDVSLDEEDTFESQSAISSMISLATELVAGGHLQRRAVVFGLLLAGVSTTDANERIASVRLLKDFEAVALGCNTRATRELLEAVLLRKDEHTMAGIDENVDWMLMAQELGWQHLVNHGW